LIHFVQPIRKEGDDAVTVETPVIVAAAGHRHVHALETRDIPREAETYVGREPMSVTAVVVKVAQSDEASAVCRTSWL
jgi:hypothetical protein